MFIAPFADLMADGTTVYVTHSGDDAVASIASIASSQGIFPAPMGSNGNSATFANNADSGEKHGMLGYLAGYRTEITNHLIAVKSAAFQPTGTIPTGLIMISVTWTGSQDLDLHILEPQAHVYQGAPNGRSGDLDLQDSNGNGPEHYYTGCTLDTGNYQVKLNYFAGSGIPVATVEVRAGTQYYSRVMTLSSVASGSAGSTTPPYFACTINVSGSVGAYRYTITPAP